MAKDTDARLIDALRLKYKEQKTTGFGVWDFLAAFGSTLDALVYHRLFCPKFIKFEGMVFLEESLQDERDAEQIRSALKHFGDDRTATERSFNTIEIPSGIFTQGALDTADEFDRLLIAELVTLWTIHLARSFPESTFAVTVVEPKETGGEVGICFYTER